MTDTMAGALKAGRALPLSTKIFYGIGAVAFGVRDLGFNTLILIFYNQVLGLPATLAGAALTTTLMFDAVVDPVVGRFSDRLRSPLGRRHPLMYAALAPAALCYYLLWTPPVHAGQTMLFWYLLTLSLGARFFISLFEAPFSALTADLSADYDQRTSIATYQNVFGWWGGVTLALLAYGVFLRPTAGDASGMLNRHGFVEFALTGSIIMFTAMLVSAVGTQRGEVRAQPSAPSCKASIWRTVGNSSLIALLGAATLTSTASAIYSSLFNYFQAYFFGLTTIQIGVLAAAPFLSALIALLLSPVLTRGREKRTLAFVLLVGAIVGQPAMIVLRLADVLPANGDPLLLPLLAFHSAFESMLWVLVWVLLSSMQADVVEDVQRRTGEQAAGLLFALRAFVGKVISSSAVLITGVLLDVVHFPARAQPGSVSLGILTRLGLYFTPLYLAIGLAAAVCLMGYRISRAVHSNNLAAVARDV